MFKDFEICTFEYKNKKEMKVDIWSDIRCPFCYVGKKNFEKALHQFPQSEKIEVTWHSFQLDPHLKTQPDKNSLDYFSEIKGVSEKQAKEMYAHVYKAGKEALIKRVADEYKPMLDDKVYDALLKYVVFDTNGIVQID